MDIADVRKQLKDLNWFKNLSTKPKFKYLIQVKKP